MNGPIVSVIVICCFLSTVNSIPNDYWTERAQILVAEQNSMLGGQLVLKNDERIVNDILMAKKRAEFESGLFLFFFFLYLTCYTFSNNNFYTLRNLINDNDDG